MSEIGPLLSQCDLSDQQLSPLAHADSLQTQRLAQIRATVLRLLNSKTTISFLDQGIVSATSFATAVIIGRMCSKGELGLYMLSMSLILFATDLQTSIISTPYMVYVPRLNKERKALYTGSTLIHQLVFSCLLILSFAGAGALAGHAGQSALAQAFWMAAAVGVGFMLREYGRRLWFARLQLTTALAMDICISVAQISGLLLLVHLHLLSGLHAFGLLGIVNGAVLLLWLVSAFP